MFQCIFNVTFKKNPKRHINHNLRQCQNTFIECHFYRLYREICPRESEAYFFCHFEFIQILHYILNISYMYISYLKYPLILPVDPYRSFPFFTDMICKHIIKDLSVHRWACLTLKCIFTRSIFFPVHYHFHFEPLICPFTAGLFEDAPRYYKATVAVDHRARLAPHPLLNFPLPSPSIDYTDRERHIVPLANNMFGPRETRWSRLAAGRQSGGWVVARGCFYLLVPIRRWQTNRVHLGVNRTQPPPSRPPPPHPPTTRLFNPTIFHFHRWEPAPTTTATAPPLAPPPHL